jgi:autotransporter-associated beta strand protein/uncharacterized repeat protein (TIGR03803 family)
MFFALIVCTTARAVAQADFRFTSLASLSGPSNGGPAAGVVLDAQGNIFGTTNGSGAFSSGSVVELSASSHTITTLASFSGDDGSLPQSNLVIDQNGNLFGETQDGGLDSFGGTVFRVDGVTHALTDLVQTGPASQTSAPVGTPLFDSQGNLTIAALQGGTSGVGSIFKVAAGTNVVTTTATFNGQNGAFPQGGVIADASGNLYGVAQGGVGFSLANHTPGAGIVYKISATTHQLVTIAQFDGGTGGSGPVGELALDNNGNLFGVTQRGGTSDKGTIFEIVAGSGTVTALASFDGIHGSGPLAGLLLDLRGNLFGTTAAGGASGLGTVFELVSGSHTITTLIDFNRTNGAVPLGSLAADRFGNLLGTTQSGGANNQGTIFELTPIGTWTGTTGTNWGDNGNWSGAAPGATAVITNTDTAIFNQTAPNSPLSIDAGRNVKSVKFDTARINSLFIGTTSGNALLLTRGGTVQTTSTVINPQTVNAPLVLEGDYTLRSDSSSNSATLSFGGRIIPGSTSGVTTLVLDGGNLGANTISGPLTDNGPGQLAIAKSGGGVWILSGANSYSGDTTVLSGTLKFNITSGTPTIASGVTATVASGATLELAGAVSALGVAGGNRVHLVNNSTASGVVVSGTNQVVGAIDGTGSVQVTAGSDLTANHIIQCALSIGGTTNNPVLVTIATSDAAGNPLADVGLAATTSLPNPPLSAGVNLADPLINAKNGDPFAASPPPLDSNLTAAPAVVPEPSSLFLLVVGGSVVGSAAVRRRRPHRFGTFSRCGH